jgi:nicotinamidase-related amidase
MFLRADRLDADRAAILVIDLQEKLLPLIAGHDEIVRATVKLLRGSTPFAVPVLATEQYPQGIGKTVEPVAVCLRERSAAILDKMTFSCCTTDVVRAAITALDRPQIIVAGIEAHVCIQQTVLDLRTMDYDVFVCADAVGSRGRADYDLALSRMQQAGAAVTSVESVLFELCHECGTERFRAMLEVIKSLPPSRT